MLLLRSVAVVVLALSKVSDAEDVASDQDIVGMEDVLLDEELAEMYGTL